jgi:hypothetical protein
MYKVIIQSTPVGESNWRVVTTGMWNPGEPPRLAEEILPANVVESTVQHHTFGNESIRANQMQDGDTLYAVVFRRLSR